jgi:dynein heavy chain
LIEGLEATKQQAEEINRGVIAGKETEREINTARDIYRKVASEGALLFFMLSSLNKISHMYQYSLDSFTSFYVKGLANAAAAENQETRVKHLRGSVRIAVFRWVSRGLFEIHKLTFLSLLTLSLMRRKVIQLTAVGIEHVDFLVRGPKEVTDNPLNWLPNSSWASLVALCKMEEFAKLETDIVDAQPRFREWYNLPNPEMEKLPLDWVQLDKTPFLKLLVVKCLRPDRINMAMSNFVRSSLPDGAEFTECDTSLNSQQKIESCLKDAGPECPIYFILSPGTDVVGEVDKLAVKAQLIKGESYHNVSMGQGQDVVAMEKLNQAHRQGHWVILNNVRMALTHLPLTSTHPLSSPPLSLPLGTFDAEMAARTREEARPISH